MDDKITENTIEKFAIELLESFGYQYIYAPSIAPRLGLAGRTLVYKLTWQINLRT